MSVIGALGLATALLCGFWVWGSGLIGLLGWAGFAGCTAYFACPEKGWGGVKLTMCCTMSGVFWAMISMVLGNVLKFSGSSIIFCIVATYFMCVQNKFQLLSFIPGTFVGSFSTFATNGDWKIIIPSLLFGAILGVACDKSGAWIFNKFGKKEPILSESIETTVLDHQDVS